MSKSLRMPAFAAIGVAAFLSFGQPTTSLAHHETQDAWGASGHDGVKYLHMDGQVINIWHAEGYDARRDRMSA
jgi:hypothetical protein